MEYIVQLNFYLFAIIFLAGLLRKNDFQVIILKWFLNEIGNKHINICLKSVFFSVNMDDFAFAI